MRGLTEGEMGPRRGQASLAPSENEDKAESSQFNSAPVSIAARTQTGSASGPWGRGGVSSPSSEAAVGL